MIIPKTACYWIATFVAAFGIPATSQAQLLSSESFSGYTVGPALPVNTPAPTIPGYTGNWAAAAFGTAQPVVTSGSLVYGGAGYAAGTGDKAAKAADGAGIVAGNSGRTSRMLDSSLAVTDSTSGTLYLSWLYKNGNENAAANATTYSTLALWNGDAGTDNLRTFEGGIADGDFGTTNYAFRLGNSNSTRGNFGVALDANVHLFVVKFTLSATAGLDSATVWLDPTLGAGDPTGGISFGGLNLKWDRLALSDYASNSMAWDEIRFGTSFDAVTVAAVPEPRAWALALPLCGVLIVLNRRFRQCRVTD